MNKPYWESKTIHEMTTGEWESLCCRCGNCCLHRLRDGKTGKSYFTKIACRYLDLETCLCTIYKNRFRIERECKKITSDNILKFKWLPKTCGYRTVAEGKDLKWWHPLISGSPDTVHAAGISIRHKKVFSEVDMVAGDLLKYMFSKSARLS